MIELIDIKQVVFPESHYLCICGSPELLCGNESFNGCEGFEIKFLTPEQFTCVLHWGDFHVNKHLVSYKISNVYINKSDFDCNIKYYPDIFDQERPEIVLEEIKKLVWCSKEHYHCTRCGKIIECCKYLETQVVIGVRRVGICDCGQILVESERGELRWPRRLRIMESKR